MKVHFTQIYVKPGVEFPFSHHFQVCVSGEVTALVVPSTKFIENYGRDFDLTFNVSAKGAILDNEIKGPTVFKMTKDVEYSIFLPFDVIRRNGDVIKSALTYLFEGARLVFETLDIDTTKLIDRQEMIIQGICADPDMFEQGDGL